MCESSSRGDVQASGNRRKPGPALLSRFGSFGTTLAAELNWVTAHSDKRSRREQLIATAWDSRSEVLSGRTLAT